jgi:uncharacterized protein (DUF305 family)
MPTLPVEHLEILMKIRLLAIAAAIIAAPSLAVAQGAHHGGHSGHSTPSSPGPAADTPATKAYRDANARMHRNMDIPFSNDADVDFVRGMIPHHQGAIDMAKVLLEHGKDEQTRKWAADVIREQEREIAEMQAWLKKRGL